MIAVADLEAYLQQDLADYVVEAEAAIGQASAVVEAHCKRSFAHVVDDSLTMRWRPSVVLPNPPVIAVTSFEVDGEPAGYDIDDSGRLWPLVRGSQLEITYTHGYPVTPHAVRLVACRIAARIFKNPAMRVNYSVDSASYQSAPDVAPRVLTGDEMAVLRRYRLHSAA